MEKSKETRIVGIRHRVKQSVEGEARPTQLALLENGKIETYNLADDTAELDWVRGCYPIKFRKVEPEDELTKFAAHHIQWKKLKDDEKSENFPENHRRKDGNLWFIAAKVPEEYDGLRQGDTIAMVLGGSGDRLAYALSRRGEQIGATVLRIPTHALKAWREEKKDKDAITLANLAHSLPELFYPVKPRDRAQIALTVAWKLRIDSMKARIACEQRLRQQIIGEVFCSPDGFYDEGNIEKLYSEKKANDIIFQNLDAEEKKREKDLLAAIQEIGIFHKLFEDIAGAGPMIAARLIVKIIDIRRFWVEPDSKEMLELLRQAEELERLGKFKEDENKIFERVREITASGQKVNHYRLLQLVSSWKKKSGKTEEAEFLDKAIECRHKRAQLRRQAERKGANKFKKFCGVHVKNDGTFPRRRSGEKSAWPEETRQAVYLIGDQFNRRPNSKWGAKLREFKLALRQRHPDTLCQTCGCKWSDCDQPKTHKRIYSDSHIHKMATWRTLTRFIEWLYMKWTRIEKSAQE